MFRIPAPDPTSALVAGLQVEGSLFSDVTWTKRGTTNSLEVETTNGVPTFGNSSTQIGPVAGEQLRSTANILGRAGFLVRPDLLLYGLGGV